MTKLHERLYNKASAEQKAFVDNLKQQTPEQIIEQAYELVMREDILITFENKELPANEVKALLKLKEPIADCYARWLHNDYSHMDMLKDTVSEFAKDLIKHNAEQKKAKKEPER